MDTGPETLRRISKMRRFNAWLMDLVRPHLRGRILEIGCGRGNITELLLAEAPESLTALDLSPHHIQSIRQRWPDAPCLRTLCADVVDPALRQSLAGTAETVVCLNVLEHIADDDAALRTMAAALTPGGRLVLLVPALPALYGTMDLYLGHHRRYSRRRLLAQLSAADLQPLSCRYFGLMGVAGWFLNSRILKRPILPEGQLMLYDRLVPLFRLLERLTGPPIGQSLFCVAEKS